MLPSRRSHFRRLGKATAAPACDAKGATWSFQFRSAKHDKLESRRKLRCLAEMPKCIPAGMQECTTLHVDKVMHKNDIDQIQQCLGFLDGVVRVGVNLLESVVYVEHNVAQISARQLLSDHVMPQYPNRIACDAQDEITQRATSAFSESSLALSKFVESTLTLNSM